MLTLNSDFVYRKIFDVNLLIPVRRNSISNDTLSLNNTAGVVFQECANANDAHSLAMLLCEKFIGVSKEEIYADLKTYIEDLISSGLLIEKRS